MMQQTHQDQLADARRLWLSLVRAGCATLTLSRTPGITVTQRFDPAISVAELELLGRSSRYVAGEFGMAAEIEIDGSSLSVRIAAAEPPAPQLETPANTEAVILAASKPSVLLRFLRHLRSAREAAV